MEDFAPIMPANKIIRTGPQPTITIDGLQRFLHNMILSIKAENVILDLSFYPQATVLARLTSL